MLRRPKILQAANASVIYTASEEEIPEFDSMEAELKVEAALEYLAGRYSSLQTGRAAPALIEGVGVNSVAWF